MIDISSLGTSNEPAVMNVRHPQTNEILLHDDGTPFTISLLGSDHPKVKEVSNEHLDRRLRNPGQSIAVGIDVGTISILMAATVDWNIVLNGKVPPCEPNTIRQVYSKYPWLRDQADEFVGNRSNYFKGGAA